MKLRRFSSQPSTLPIEKILVGLRPSFLCKADLQLFTHLSPPLLSGSPFYTSRAPSDALRCLHYHPLLTFLFRTYPFRWTFLDLPGTSRKTRKDWSKPEYLEIISGIIPIEKMEDWRNLEYKVVKDLHGNSLLDRNGTILGLLRACYPGFGWERVWRFPTEAGGAERRVFVDRLLLEGFGVGQQQDLAFVSSRALGRSPGGHTILHLARSPESAFQDLYPELLPRFGRVSRGYWDNLKQQDLLTKTMKQFQILTKEDWYRLSDMQISIVFGSKVPKRTLFKLLAFLLPEEEWDYVKFADKINKRSRQKWLGVKLRELYGNELIFEDHTVRILKRTWVFDFYLPGRRFVVEYQGEQHYFSVLKWMTLEEQRRRDEEKEGYCYEHGLGLVCVPYWWDGSTESLKGIIEEQLDDQKRRKWRKSGRNGG